MLFNSYTFLLLFLPALLAAYWVVNRVEKPVLVIAVLLAGSVFFYAWWSIPYLGLLGVSIIFNYSVGARLLSAPNRALLGASIGLNLLLLGYFKYTNFLIREINEAFDLTIGNDAILLPLAISFFTFQQIAYLVDSYRGQRLKSTFQEYALFVSFFPQLIAGPIVRATEILPQIRNAWSSQRRLSEDLAPGMTLFLIGLGKKVVIADSLSAYASPVFAAADAGLGVTTVEAWIAALSYTFQLYFDFSGYSDMAIGLAWMFGIRLPVNFYSPYQALSVADFWRRWHMTLSRFLREYLYIPLGGNRSGPARQSINLLITMLLGGIWHGAGWTFVIWGALHGLYLIVNQWWTRLSNGGLIRLGAPGRVVAWALTIFAIILAWVMFRSETVSGAGAMLQAMLIVDGLTLPRDYRAFLGPALPVVDGLGGSFQGDQILWRESKTLIGIWLIISSVIVLMLPNTAQLFELRGEDTGYGATLRFRPGVIWLIIAMCLLVSCFVAMTDVSEFLYYQF